MWDREQVCTCVITVVRSEENISVIQLLYVFQFLYQLLHQVVYRQKGLPPKATRPQSKLTKHSRRAVMTLNVYINISIPSTESVVKIINGAVQHRVNRLTQQPVLVLKKEINTRKGCSQGPQYEKGSMNCDPG